jgi:hypothetical protein
MDLTDSESEQKYAESSTPIFPGYLEKCVFHACFGSGKILHEIVEFLNIVHEVVVFQISNNGLTMKADDRPFNREGGNVKEGLFTDLHIPPTGFSSWFYAAGNAELEDGKSKTITPIPVNAQTLRANMKGSILAKDSIILYITRDDVDYLHMRITPVGSSTYKVDGATKLLNLESLPNDIMEPLNTPYYDLTNPIVTFKSVQLSAACKDAKTIKVSELTINFHKCGIVITFGNSEGHKNYPHGLTNMPVVYSAKFQVKKRFEALAKCTRLGTNVSVFATKGKPVLFVFNIKDTGGKLGIYLVPSSEGK